MRQEGLESRRDSLGISAGPVSAVDGGVGERGRQLLLVVVVSEKSDFAESMDVGRQL